MNWSRALIAGVVAGFVVNLADFVMHGLMLGPAYRRYPVFAQEPANPIWFLVISVGIALPATLLFARTREIWREGVAGGATYGFWLGLISFFPPFYNVLVLEGYPYHLTWCWAGINLIDSVLLGTVAGIIYKTAGASPGN